jgi:putative ABC transport system substrate-binding protein
VALVKGLIRALLIVALGSAWSAAPRAAGTDTTPVAVIYPGVREPYRAAFVAIVSGIEAELGSRAKVAEVDPAETSTDIAARIAAQKAGRVILLGKYGLDIAQSLQTPAERLVGAVLARPAELPAGMRGMSMVPSPAKLFGKLREFSPGIKRVNVVHGADENDWLIELGRSAAQEQGLELETVRRDTLRDGANAYRDLLGRMDPATEAIWLPQGSPFLAESSVLQMILRTAWDRNIIVFSSNVAHVPKGALFALFPDNTEMGRALGKMASGPPRAGAGLEVLEQLDTAINIRTANHLGLGFTAGDKRFDMVFPSR